MRKGPAIIVGLLAVAAAGYAVWYRWQQTQPSYLLIQARQAIESGKPREAERFAALLDQNGDPDAARLIRGKASHAEGKQHLERASQLSALDSSQLLWMLMFDTAAWACHPISPAGSLPHNGGRLRGIAPKARPWLRERSELENRARTAWQQTLQQLDPIDQESPLFGEAAALIGECLYRLGNIKDAMNLLNLAVQHDPESVEAHRWLAVIHFDQGSMFPPLICLQAQAV